MSPTLAACFVSLLPHPAPPDRPRYEFVPNVDRLVGIDRDDCTLIGRLDRDGVFTHTHRQEFTRGSDGVAFFIGSGPGYTLLNVGGVTPTPVYEYRSGMLIPGTMRAGGRFVPEAGGRIIRFEEYEYSPAAVPIWNLPGSFRRR